MIPLSVSDILKILDQIPIWKTVSSLPKRIAELEQRVALLEGKAALPAPVDPARVCPLCQATMKVTAEKAHPDFGFAGMNIHEMLCEACGHKTERSIRPGKGYL